MISSDKQEDALFQRLPKEIQEKITQLRQKTTIQKIWGSAIVEETDFVLFYAFYKDLASTNRVTIPTFHQLSERFTHQKNQSVIVFLKQESVVLGSCFILLGDTMSVIQGVGVIREAFENGGIEYLLWQAILTAGEMKHKGVILGSDEALPLKKHQRIETIAEFHGMIGL